MKLKRFEALTLQGALRAVKAELGPDAVIVSTRRVHKGGGLFGLLSQPVVEVTAAVDRSRTLPFSKWVGDERGEEDRRSMEDDRKPEIAAPDEVKPREPGFDAELRIATMLDPFARQLTDVQEELRRIREDRNSPEGGIGPLRQELEGLRMIVSEALGDRMRRRVAALPGDLAGEYEALVAEGVQPQLAHDFLRSVAETLGTAGLANPAAVRQVLQERIEGAIAVSGSIVPADNLRKVVMLVGPTGVGKTTTIAKLASWASRAEPPCKTVLITLDTYRIAAVEQLRVFAKILKVPLEVAVSPEDLGACIERNRAADLILIDTAGRSPRDRIGQNELQAIARHHLKIETHLVLAAPTAESVLREVVRRYQSVPIHRVLVTKLDEAGTFGGVFNLLHDTGLPISYLSAGQRVPEDLELATKRRIAELLVHQNPRPSSEAASYAGAVA